MTVRVKVEGTEGSDLELQTALLAIYDGLESIRRSIASVSPALIAKNITTDVARVVAPKTVSGSLIITDRDAGYAFVAREFGTGIYAGEAPYEIRPVNKKVLHFKYRGYQRGPDDKDYRARKGVFVTHAYVQGVPSTPGYAARVERGIELGVDRIIKRIVDDLTGAKATI